MSESFAPEQSVSAKPTHTKTQHRPADRVGASLPPRMESAALEEPSSAMSSKPTHSKTQHRPADRVGASLPPRVSGEALGEVEVAVSECRGAEALSLVLRWWGEGDAPQAGVVFEASRKNPRRGENSCLFPVRVDEHGIGRYLRDARLLRFDVVAHGRVVGALKVPLTKAPLGRVPGDGELGLVDARFSAVSNPPKTTSHSAAPRKVLGSARVRLVVRMRSKSRVRSALKPRGALVGSFDGPAAAAAGPPRETAARKAPALASTIPKVGLKSKFYKDPEATGVALPVGTAGTLGAAKRRKKPPLAATYRQQKPTANPWGPVSDDDEEPDAAAATAEVAPPVDEVERFVESDMTAPPPREAVEDDAQWTVEDDAAEAREEAVLEGLLRRGEALREQIARAEYSTPSRGDDAVTAFVDAELDAATRPPPTKPPPPESESELSDDEDRDEGRAFATAPATRATGGMVALQRRAASLASELDDTALLAHADDDIVEQLLQDPDLNPREARAADEAPAPAAPPPPARREPEAPVAAAAAAPAPPDPRALRCLLRVRGLRLDRGTAATCGRARVAHRWSLPNAPERPPRRDGKFGSRPADGARGAYALGPYDCAAPFAVDDAFRVGRAVQVVEVWAEAPDGASERLIGLAKLRGDALAAALDRERRRVVRAQRLFDVAAGADARLDEWLLDGGRAVVADFAAALVDPLSQLRRGAVDATLALGTPSQLAALEDARAFDKAAKIQSLLRARAARRRPAPPPPPPPPAPAAPAGAPLAAFVDALDDAGLLDDDVSALSNYDGAADDGAAYEDPADVAVGAAAVRHVLEIAAVGPCRLPGARGGATVSYAVLGGEPASLWWDGDSPQLNSRGRHDFETTAPAAAPAAAAALLRGRGGVAFTVAPDGGGAAFEALLAVRDVKRLVAAAAAREVVRIPLADASGLRGGDLALAVAYRREPAGVLRTRARRAAPPAERLAVRIGELRGLGGVLRAWRAQGAGSGTFPLAERPERGVSFVAEVEAVLVFGDGGALEFRSQPFSFVAEDRRDDAPGDLVDEVVALRAGRHPVRLDVVLRLLDVRVGDAGTAAVDGPLGVPLARCSAPLAVDERDVGGWLALKPDVEDAAGDDVFSVTNGAVHVTCALASAAAVPPPRRPETRDAATAVAESLELPPAGDARPLLRAAAAAPPPAPPRSAVAAAPRSGVAVLTVVVEAAERLSVPPFRPETPTEDWRWSVSWRSLDGRHAGDTAPAAGALRPDGLFAVEWAAEFAAELPVAALRDGALAFDVLVRAKHAPNAAKLGSVTVDLGLLACGMTRLDGSYQLSDDFRRDRGALRLKIGAAVGAPEIAGARFVAAPRAAPVVAAARPDPPRLAPPGPCVAEVEDAVVFVPAPEGPESPGRRREGFRADHLEARARALDAGGVSLADLAGVVAGLDAVGEHLRRLGGDAPPAAPRGPPPPIVSLADLAPPPPRRPPFSPVGARGGAAVEVVAAGSAAADAEDAAATAWAAASDAARAAADAAASAAARDAAAELRRDAERLADELRRDRDRAAERLAAERAASAAAQAAAAREARALVEAERAALRRELDEARAAAAARDADRDRAAAAAAADAAARHLGALAADAAEHAAAAAAADRDRALREAEDAALKAAAELRAAAAAVPEPAGRPSDAAEGLPSGLPSLAARPAATGLRASTSSSDAVSTSDASGRTAPRRAAFATAETERIARIMRGGWAAPG